MCQSELTEFFAELTEFAVKLSEFSSPKQYSRNSIPLPFPRNGPKSGSLGWDGRGVCWEGGGVGVVREKENYYLRLLELTVPKLDV